MLCGSTSWLVPGGLSGLGMKGSTSCNQEPSSATNTYHIHIVGDIWTAHALHVLVPTFGVRASWFLARGPQACGAETGLCALLGKHDQSSSPLRANPSHASSDPKLCSRAPPTSKHSTCHPSITSIISSAVPFAAIISSSATDRRAS